MLLHEKIKVFNSMFKYIIFFKIVEKFREILETIRGIKVISGNHWKYIPVLNKDNPGGKAIQF